MITITTVFALVITSVLAVLTWSTHSLTLAITLLAVTWFLVLLFETLAVTIMLHRFLTHGSIRFRNKTAIKFWLWFARSGGVTYYQWVIIHAWHHAYVDTTWDSYTPNYTNELTGQPPLKAPWPWNFWMNAQSYRKMWFWIDSHDYELQELANTTPAVRLALERLEMIAWAKKDYTRVWRGQVIAILIFVIAAVPLAIWTDSWLAIVMITLVPGVLFGLKVALYLYGGQIINYWGHRAAGEQHQSDIPWIYLIFTFGMMGEGWHELHHDEQRNARFHRVWDIGWWCIVVMYHLLLIDSITVAVPTQVPRQYLLRNYHPKPALIQLRFLLARM